MRMDILSCVKWNCGIFISPWLPAHSQTVCWTLLCSGTSPCWGYLALTKHLQLFKPQMRSLLSTLLLLSGESWGFFNMQDLS